ncbi:hypothetical protein [Deinococcus cavernae]|uniref:hypothetical protein n=1 Tax=Deinococcus cavernae TaxID=2320857 RepID=UPI0013146B57|nr:hypothetical protein [Deinococcus cavernae]
MNNVWYIQPGCAQGVQQGLKFLLGPLQMGGGRFKQGPLPAQGLQFTEEVNVFQM